MSHSREEPETEHRRGDEEPIRPGHDHVIHRDGTRDQDE